MRPSPAIYSLASGAGLISLICLGLPSPSRAAATAWIGDAHAAVRLVTATDAIDDATSIEVGLEFRYAPGWHGYWRTPGDAGIPPVVDWSKTPGLTMVTMAWPTPNRIVIGGLQNAVYEGRVVLPLRLTLTKPRGSDTGTPADLQATVDYAACSNVCVPFHAELALALPPGPQGLSAEASEIAAARSTIPGPPGKAGIDVLGTSRSGAGPEQELIVSLRSVTVPFEKPDLFVEGAGDGMPAAPSVAFGDGGHTAVLTVKLGEALPRAGGLALTLTDGSRSAAFAGPKDAPVVARATVWPALLSALAGGLILNLMPCVLPVLSIKLIGLTRQSGSGRGAVRVGFLATGLGIVTSFMAIATALVGLKWSGASLGWGIQFQQPWFLAVMAVLTVTFAASLFDWIHIGIPQAVMDLTGAGTITRRDRGAQWAEPFLAGAFATLLATPCSAPFVGTAVGFALAGSGFDILSIFFCLGLGMALPFLAAALVPGVAACLPRPGPWMITLRRGLGLLLLGTAVWLLAILWNVAGGRSAIAGGLVLAGLLALLAWNASRNRTGLHWPKRTAVVSAILWVFAAGSQSTVDATAVTGSGHSVAFDLATLDRLVGDGQTVLVDVSASWCLTCKLNELTALTSKQVRDRLARPDTVLMRADWSRPDPAIARYIATFGRFGIPLDVVYGPRQSGGELLPELLTTKTLISALDRAVATETPAAAIVRGRDSAPSASSSGRVLDERK